MTTKIINAVSALIYDSNSFLIVTRSPAHSMFPGYTSLPGGIIKAEESPRLALAREIREELQIELALEDIAETPLAQMSSPPFHPNQVINQIYLVVHKKERPAITLNEEHSSAHWLSATELLNSWNNGERAIIPPFRLLFEKLASLNINQIVNLQLGELTIQEWANPPIVEMIHGIEQCLVISPTLSPHTMTNAFFIGDILVDPSPLTHKDFLALDEAFKKRKINKIFLTHTHADHFHLIQDWGPHWNLPIMLSEYCYEDLKEKLPASLFQILKWQIIGQGEVVTHWQGNDVFVDEVPGHHQGQLALYSNIKGESHPAWYLASDLFQSGGSVVIGVADGDLLDYLKSLEKVIQLAPRFIFPSHGMVHGGVEMLKKIHHHRVERHRDIIKLHNEGMTEQEILQRLYFMIDKNLWPLALENIRSHLKAVKKKS